MCGGPTQGSGFGWLSLLLFLDPPGGSHMQIELSTTGLGCDSFDVGSPVMEASLESQAGHSFLLSNATGRFLYLNFSPAGLLQRSWFPMGEIRQGAICCHLKRTGHQSIAEMGPWLVESLRGQILSVSGQQRKIWLMATKNACKPPFLVPHEILGVGLAWGRLKRQAQHVDLCPGGMTHFLGPLAWQPFLGRFLAVPRGVGSVQGSTGEKQGLRKAREVFSKQATLEVGHGG